MTWVSPPKKFAKTVEGDLNRHAKRLGIQILRSLTFVSPVDTGRFRNNWVVGIKRRNKETLGSTKSETKFAGAALQRGINVLKSYKTGSIFVSNNLPYAGRLNDGHSTQAPANFVQKAIAKVIK